MFTGIVTDTGKIISMKQKGDSIAFAVQPTKRGYLKDTKTGDSMSIDGACMTIEKTTGNKFQFTTIKESLSKTNLGYLSVNSFVNLEKPMKMNSTLDGHIVQGHVDTTGTVEKINRLRRQLGVFCKILIKV